MMRKGLLLVIFIALLAASFLAYRQTQPPAVTGKILYSVVDCTGVEVGFKAKPQWIVSLSTGTDEIILHLVAPERIAALTYLSDDDKISSVTDKAKLVKGRMQSGNAEGVMAMKPDLVIMPDWHGNAAVSTWRSMGLNVYVYKTPNNFSEIQKCIRELAKVVGEKEKGEQIVAKMTEELEAVSEKVKGIGMDKKLTAVGYSPTGMFGGQSSTFSDICQYANVVNGLANLNRSPGTVSEEYIISVVKPDMIVIPDWSYGKKANAEDFARKLLEDPTWQNTKAVKNKKIVMLNAAYLYSTSQYAVKAVEELAKAAYPEAFAKKNEK